MTVRNALDEAFESARRDGRAALIPYLTAGFPDPDRFVDLAGNVLAEADALEIGVPFSDPLLDGPTIQRSTQRALDLGITPPRALEYAAAVHQHVAKPLLMMGAYNPILAYGLDRYCEDAQRAGVTGLLVPDVPLEEQDELRVEAETRGLHVIRFLAPSSSDERVRRACQDATGFIYCISIAGVTGARRNVTETARPLVKRVKACTDVPVAVGFGISSPEAAREVAGFADGVIVGAALIDVLSALDGTAVESRAVEFVRGLRRALEGTAVG